jgi:hypothetical protein
METNSELSNNSVVDITKKEKKPVKRLVKVKLIHVVPK